MTYKELLDKLLEFDEKTLQEAQEAIRLIRKYKEPVYHYVE